MFIRLLCFIFVLSSVPVYAGERAYETATIPNPRILNQDPVTARQEANAAALGKMEEHPGQYPEIVRREILKDLDLRNKGKVAENYHSLYNKVKSHLSHTPQRKDVRALWEFVKDFFEEAQDPSRWLTGKTPEEIAEAEKYARMTTEDLEKELAKYYRFSTYTLRTLDWKHFREDAIGNFMNGIIHSRQILADSTGGSEIRAIYEERLTAATIFREWVYRHWDGKPKSASFTLFPNQETSRAPASSLGEVMSEESVQAYYGVILSHVEQRIIQAKDHRGVRWPEEHMKMFRYAKKLLEEARHPAGWLYGETPEEQTQTRHYSNMSNAELKSEFEKIKKFANYSLDMITESRFFGDTLPNFLYGPVQWEELCKQRGWDYGSEDHHMTSRAKRIFREWVYRHWDGKPKKRSHTHFPDGDQIHSLVMASSLGDQQVVTNDRRQALVFQMSGEPNSGILNQTAEMVRANPEKTIIFVVGSHAAYTPIRAALKARGVGAKQLDSFEVNPLRTTADANRFARYVEGLQAKFSANNDIAVIADFRILSALGVKETILLARDKAGQGTNHEPVSLTEIRTVEREGADSALFNLGWNLLSASNVGNFRDQIEQDSSTGVWMIRIAALSNFIEHWLRERENAKQLLSAA